MPVRLADVTCGGCRGTVPGDEVAYLWVDHPLGLTCAKSHRTQKCAKAAVAASGGKLRPGNRPPESKEEKLLRLAKGHVTGS